ncbi:MAG: hypothetical protein JNL24_00375 [Bacteroidia bacterium]|nr:hypothetical protein [Bacteroidia bacterium]
MYLKKAVFIFSFLFSTSTLISKDGTDSLFSIEYKTTAFTFIKHQFTEFSNNNIKIIDFQSFKNRIRNNSNNNIFDIHTLRIKKGLGKYIVLGTGVNHTKERFPGINGNTLKTENDTTWSHTIGSAITYKYIGIPLFVSAQLNYTKFFKAHFEAGVNFDFIYSEIHEETKDYKFYYVYTGNAPPVTETVILKTYDTNPRKDRLSFNRITPYLSISFERYLFKNKLSLNVGSVFYFKSIYQEHNTGEYIKNIRFSPLTLGANFHF